MTSDRSEREQVRRIEAAAATLRAIADCLADGAQPPGAFGKTLGVLSDELAALRQEVSRNSPPEQPAVHSALTTAAIGRRGAARSSLRG